MRRATPVDLVRAAMSRDWKIIVEFQPATPWELIERAEIALAEFEPDRVEDAVYCYVNTPRSLERAKRSIMHELRAAGVSERVVLPLRELHWNSGTHLYIDPELPPAPPPRLAPDEVTWAVLAIPFSVFVFRQVRFELEQRKLTELCEHDKGIEVGARDEADAAAIAAEVAAIPEIAATRGRRLSWFERWRVRQHLIGNYAGPPDPTQPS